MAMAAPSAAIAQQGFATGQTARTSGLGTHGRPLRIAAAVADLHPRPSPWQVGSDRTYRNVDKRNALRGRHVPGACSEAHPGGVGTLRMRVAKRTQGGAGTFRVRVAKCTQALARSGVCSETHPGRCRYVPDVCSEPHPGVGTFRVCGTKSAWGTFRVSVEGAVYPDAAVGLVRARCPYPACVTRVNEAHPGPGRMRGRNEACRRAARKPDVKSVRALSLRRVRSCGPAQPRSSNSSRPISIRRISLVPAPIA